MPTNLLPPAEASRVPLPNIYLHRAKDINMDAEDNVMASHEERRAKDQQVDNAIRAIQQKKPLPEIDFTIHTMEDGTQVSTMERVCKGMLCSVATRDYPAQGFDPRD